MSTFDPESFLSETPEPSSLVDLKKDDLIKLASHLKLKVKRSMKKMEIRNIIIEHLVQTSVFDESAMELYEVVSSELELKQLDIQVQLELKKLEMQAEKEKTELEMKKLEMEERREKEKLELEMKKLEMEKKLEMQERKEREDREFELKKLEMTLAIEAKDKHSGVKSEGDKFDVAKNVRLVPPFQEQNVDQYFLHFEKLATNLKWPKNAWTMLFQSSLFGKAREVFTQLSVEQSSDYEAVKGAILKAYELVPEAYRQKFRNLSKKDGQTFVEFAREKEQIFDRWLLSMEVKDFERLRQLVLVEEFKNCVYSEVRTFIEEQKAKDLEKAAVLADEYYLTHKKTFSSNTRSSGSYKSSQKTGNNSQNQQSTSKNTSIASGKSSSEAGSSQRPVCKYCRRPGHVISECFRIKAKQEPMGRGSVKSTGFVTSTQSLPLCKENDCDNVYKIKTESVSIDKIFEPFIYDGFVCLSDDLTNATPIKILRDTGASQSLLLANTLPIAENSASATGTSVLIKGIDSSSYSPVPLHKVYLSSSLVSGPVVLGIRSSLPFDGVQLLLGNDLAGSKVIADPVVTNKPSVNDHELCEESPNLYPACAVTRAMSSREKAQSKIVDDVESVSLADTCVGQMFSGIKEGPLNLMTGGKNVSKSQLINEQHGDPEIDCLFQRAVDEVDCAEEPVCYFVRNGILMRKWRPLTAPANEEWKVHYQIVVPSLYRTEILSMAHDTPLSGHLGINKTYQKVLSHFYWPGLKKDVVQYCKTCHTCQMVGKPNQVIPKARLHPIPAFEEPFSRVLIDCVGPLPKTKTGNQYILTIMCAATRFPEAIPLRNIKVKSIVKALIKFFTLVGLPKSVQSDQGSNFMSRTFQQVMKELGIEQCRSSAYHPESQGALERFHQTLKTMMKTYCFDTEKDWDEGLHLLLFAVRESVQESLGFSPFELVFGHSVRGPLKLLKEKFLSEDSQNLNLLDYVSNFRTRLMKACELAKLNLKSSQKTMKNRYDLNAVEREFKPGDKVLAFLPVPGKPLQAKYFGPYVVSRKVSDVNYVLETPDRRKQNQLCHINMLKLYLDRNGSDKRRPMNLVVSSDDTQDENFEQDKIPVTTAKLQNTNVLNNLDAKLSHLSEPQRQDLKEIIQDFKHLFSDIPTRTDTIFHDVKLVSSDVIPVKQHPYRLNPVKQKYMKDEIQYLLDNDFIEPSESSWSSPCILVPKADGKSYRMCTDYRKVNILTKSDNFPIPRIDDCIDKIGQAKFVTKCDLLKGFWQVPLTERAKEVSAFVTADGLFQYKVMPFGMKNSPATFQRLINIVVCDIEGCEAYIDDIIIYSETWEEHLRIIRDLFRSLTVRKLTVNLEKSEFGCASVTL